MKVAIVYDSSTGKTKAAAEQMGEAAKAAGHECSEAYDESAPTEAEEPP